MSERKFAPVESASGNNTAKSGGYAPKVNKPAIYHGAEVQGKNVVAKFGIVGLYDNSHEDIKTVIIPKSDEEAAQKAYENLTKYYSAGEGMVMLKNLVQEGDNFRLAENINKKTGVNYGGQYDKLFTKAGKNLVMSTVYLDRMFSKNANGGKGGFIDTKIMKVEDQKAMPLMGDGAEEYRASVVAQAAQYKEAIEQLNTTITQLTPAMSASKDVENQVKAATDARDKMSQIVDALEELGASEYKDGEEIKPKTSQMVVEDVIALFAAGYGSDGYSSKSQEICLRAIHKETGEVISGQVRQSALETYVDDSGAERKRSVQMGAFDMYDANQKTLGTTATKWYEEEAQEHAKNFNNILASTTTGTLGDWEAGSFVVEAIPVSEMWQSKPEFFDLNGKDNKLTYNFCVTDAKTNINHYDVLFDVPLVMGANWVESLSCPRANSRYYDASTPVWKTPSRIVTPYAASVGLTEALTQNAVNDGRQYNFALDENKPDAQPAAPEVGEVDPDAEAQMPAPGV